jgi:hypothetical protein
MPPSGIANLQADLAPKLGGDLVVGGKRILGIAGTISGQIEKPKAKTYTLILKSADSFTISSMTASCEVGTVAFDLFLGLEGSLISPPPVSGAAVAGAGATETIPGDTLFVAAGSRLSLRLTPSGTSSRDFIFSIARSGA